MIKCWLKLSLFLWDLWAEISNISAPSFWLFVSIILHTSLWSEVPTLFRVIINSLAYSADTTDGFEAVKPAILFI